MVSGVDRVDDDRFEGVGVGDADLSGIDGSARGSCNASPRACPVVASEETPRRSGVHGGSCSRVDRERSDVLEAGGAPGLAAVQCLEDAATRAAGIDRAGGPWVDRERLHGLGAETGVDRSPVAAAIGAREDARLLRSGIEDSGSPRADSEHHDGLVLQPAVRRSPGPTTCSALEHSRPRCGVERLRSVRRDGERVHAAGDETAVDCGPRASSIDALDHAAGLRRRTRFLGSAGRLTTARRPTRSLCRMAAKRRRHRWSSWPRGR